MLDIDAIIPVSKIKRDLLNILKTMGVDNTAIAITRNGDAVGIMMTPQRYEALLETIEVLSNHELLKALEKSSNNFKPGRIYDDDEAWET